MCNILRNRTIMPSETVDMDTMPLRRGHFRVWIVAALGQVAGAGIATLAGIVIPMLQLILHPELSSFEQGAVACCSLVGIMIGSMLFGAWSDRTGYLLFFRLCPALVTAAALFVWLVDTPASLVVGLFLMGLGIGGDYSLDSDYISEIMPRRWRLTMVGAAKAASALGSILFAAVAYLLLKRWDDPHMWNRLWLLVAGLAAAMLLSRIRFEQSPGWLIARGRTAEAERAVRYFLGPDVRIGEIAARPRHDATLQKNAWRELFRRGNRKKIVFSGLPWACEGVGVYGIGIFLPALVMALDILKGFVSAEIGVWLAAETGGLLAFVFVIIGHTFPFWLKFHGGKGVACGAGAILALSPLVFGIALAGFVLLVAVTGYVSAGSICACLLVIISSLVLPEPMLFRVLYLLMAGTVLFMHRANIKRLLNGTESKTFHKK